MVLALRQTWLGYSTAVRLGWAVSSNWTRPLTFVIYTILRPIGRGGMGAVYLAECKGGLNVGERVALKLIKRGMDSDAIIKRFVMERQILANLDHPNIARLLDGGTTDDGLPYFVMEYVEGLPLLDYCDTQRLTTVDRLKLFRKICAAVQHAHQNLVVHRDIKPSNLIVAEDGTRFEASIPEFTLSVPRVLH